MLSRREKIDILAAQCAREWFITMLNPKFRGENFRFDTHDIGRTVRMMTGLSFTRDLNEKEIARLKEVAVFEWNKCISDSDILSWIKY